MSAPFEAFSEAFTLKGITLLDSFLSPSGIAFSIGAVSLIAGTTILKPFFSGGEKDWLSGWRAWREGLYGDPKKGIILGRYKGVLVAYNGSYHIGVDGTTGTGKTACTFLATLLMNQLHSFIVFDQSRSLYKLTSGRRAQFGTNFRLDPTIEDCDCYNPFDDIPNDGRIISNLDSLYAVLLSGSAADQKKTGGDPFWDKKPRDLLPYVTMQVLYGEDDSLKHIGGVIRYISDGISCFRDMAANPRHPQCELIGQEMLNAPEQTRTSLITTILSSLSLWRDDNVVRMTSRSSFRMEDLATNANGPITVYLTAPNIMLKRMMPFYVLMEEMLSLHLMNTEEKTLSGKPKVRPVVIMDDEAQNSKRPNLDKLEVFRKYGLWALLGYQGLDAMIELYGKSKVDLIKLKLTYRPTVGGDVVNRLVEMSGQYKKKTVTYSESRSKNGVTRTANWSIKDTPRLTKYDWEHMSEYGHALLTHPKNPALLDTFDSKVDPEFSKLIVPEYVPTSTTLVKSTWERVSKPVVRSSLVIDGESEEGHDEDGVVHEMQNPTGAILLGMEEEIEYEQPTPKKRSVSF